MQLFQRSFCTSIRIKGRNYLLFYMCASASRLQDVQNGACVLDFDELSLPPWR